MNVIFFLVVTLALEVTWTLADKEGDEAESCEPLCHCWYGNSSYGRDLNIANCSDRRISSLRELLALPTNTNVILLGHNNISKLGNGDLRKYHNLTYLDLNSNVISIIEEKAFEQLYQLVFLSLENNHVTPHVLSQNPRLFKDLANLKVLKLNGNFFRNGSEGVSFGEMYTINTYPDVFHWLLSLDTLFIDGISNATFGSGFADLTNLTKLIMSGANGHCSIGSLHNESFEYVPHLTYLDISNCSITDIEADTFSRTPNLQTLNISSNTRLGFAKLGKAFYGLQSSNISVLVANRIVRKFPKCVVIRKEDVQYLNSTSLTDLHLDGNSIMNIDRGVLGLLPKTIRFISALRHRFDYGAYIHELKYLTALEYLRLSGVHYTIDMPVPNVLEMQYSDEKVTDAFDDADDNIIHSMSLVSEIHPDFYPYSTNPVLVKTNLTLPPNLKKVHSNFGQLVTPLASIRIQADGLQHVDMSSNFLQFREGTLLGYENVTVLDLSNNLARWLSPDLFQKCSSLQVLNLSLNFFKWNIYKDTNGQVFRNLFRLKQLHIASNNLVEVRGMIFSNLTSLEILNLSKNRIYNFSPDLKNLKKLKQIDLSYNDIEWLMRDVRGQIQSLKSLSPNLTLNLSVNPLCCSCMNLETLRWLFESGVTADNMHGYYCLRDWKKRVIKNKDDFEDLIHELENECFSAVSSIWVTFMLIVCFFVVVIIGLLRRHRWKLRFLYHSARIQYKSNTSDDLHFLHDGFVSYADEDRGFVVNDMLYHMEVNDGIKLNIHHRDFMPGEPIASNIVVAIKNSRKTLVVLSRNFLNSYWCMFELRMAQMESISSGRDILILIMYEKIPTKDIPPEILKMLHTDSYLAFPSEDEDRKEFWRCLSQSVRPR